MRNKLISDVKTNLKNTHQLKKKEKGKTNLKRKLPIPFFPFQEKKKQLDSKLPSLSDYIPRNSYRRGIT